MGVLSRQQIDAMVFAFVALDARLSDPESFYNRVQISPGARTRIVDFCVLSAGEGGITIGMNVRIAVYCCLMGKGAIPVEAFANLSSHVSVYSSSDDYSGEGMTNPTVPADFTRVHHGLVRIGRHVIVGSGSVVLPGVVLEEGAAVGELSLVKDNCQAFGVYAGNPARYLKKRKDGFLDLEKAYQGTLT